MYIQILASKDIEEIKKVFTFVFCQEPWNDDWSDANQLHAYLSDLMGQHNSLTFGLYDENRLIGISLGHIKHWYEGTEYYIDELCILKNEQSKGYGTKFIELLEVELYKRDIQHFFLLTDKDVPAYSFYKKLGFCELESNVAFTKTVDPFSFEKAKLEDIPFIFQLILDRMKWMDKKGIKAWNVMEYDKVYPMSYYESMCKKNCLYALKMQNEIIAAAVLKEDDERWKDTVPAFYIHNFVTKVNSNNYGIVFLQKAEAFGRLNNKMYLRLDSALGNKSLERFYTNFGFKEVGSCQDGPYYLSII